METGRVRVRTGRVADSTAQHRRPFRDAGPLSGLRDEDELESLLSNVSCSVVRIHGYLPIPPDGRVVRRVMPHHILWVCVGGSTVAVVGEHRYRLEPGCVLLMPAQLEQEVLPNPADPVSAYVIHHVARLYGVLDVPFMFGFPVWLRPPPARMTHIVDAAQRILDEFAQPAPGSGLATHGDLARILALLWREARVGGGADRLRPVALVGDVARLAPALRAIETRYAEHLTVEQLADTVHLHPTYFSTLFRRVTGSPPHEYLARYRLDRAREMLVATDRTVTEIAVATGYRDPRYLSRVLHRADGLSPTAYRQAKRSPLFR